MKRALASSFRQYTLVAENMIAASTAEAQLVHGTLILQGGLKKLSRKLLSISSPNIDRRS